VALNLLRHLPGLSPEHTFFVFTDTEDNLGFLKGLSNVRVVTIPLSWRYEILIWEQIKLPLILRRYEIDLLHGTKNSIPLLGRCKKICTIHDLAYYLFPETFTLAQRIHLKISARIACLCTDKIIAVSKNTKKDIVRLLNAAESKVKVVYNGVDVKFFDKPEELVLKKVRAKFDLPEKFILFVGTIQPRKNIETLIKAFLEFKKKDETDYHLVLAGRKGWLYDKIVKQIEQSLHRDYIHFLGMVADEELLCLYHSASVCVYPSSYDGFGLVPLEAMAAGAPTITSNVSSLPEVVGDAAMKVSPDDWTSLAKAIESIVSDRKIRSKLKEMSVERAKEFSWKRAAEETLMLYEEVLRV